MTKYTIKNKNISVLLVYNFGDRVRVIAFSNDLVSQYIEIQQNERIYFSSCCDLQKIQRR